MRESPRNIKREPREPLARGQARVYKNKYRCAPKVWRKFDPVQRALFNKAYEWIGTDCELFTIDAKTWEVIRHNHAVMAAWAYEDVVAKIVVTDD